MNEIFDLLPIPADRDFPAGRLEVRRDALVAAVHADCAAEPFARRALRAASAGFARTWLSLLGILAVGIALLTLGFSAPQRSVRADAVAVLAAAGTVQLAVAVAPRAVSSPRHL